MRMLLISLTALGSLGAYALAQSPRPSSPTPGHASTETRLASPEVAFRAQVDRPVTRQMYADGRLVAMGGTPQGAAIACVTCHGINGDGDSAGVFPRLAEMPAWYLYKQLGDYASGNRPNEVMTAIARRMSAAERESVSVYYSVTPALGERTPDREVDGPRLQWGAKLSAIGSAEIGVPACVNCHGPEGRGLPPSVPGLAGQHATYIASQLRAWKQNERRNDPMGVMKVIADKMSDRDIDAVADYFSRMRARASDSAGDTVRGQP